ncbi:SDR family NAD(P)-dependent oxidoreductase [Massilibacterium senegalense]|uniref:SDR family NAD(P)-dependent oxidoreductase n=1 Tax=Massilibacterium senegalense TaxID=1632858 RepID=UPI00078505AD|nr:SDR family oxidoreductase [Massilibacterium senegalense]
MTSLRDKTIVITGASSGIGKEIAGQCVEQHANVILLARRADVLVEIKKELDQKGTGSVSIYPVDVANQQQVASVFQRIGETYPTIDVLMNNAGFGIFETFMDITDEEMKRMFQVNVFGVFYCTQEALKIMKKQQKGHIITTASIAGKMATAKSSIYAATKHAVIGMMNALRLELSTTDIDVTLLNPGPIRTNFFELADRSGTYEKAVERYMLDPVFVAKKVIEAIHQPKREINLPWWMGIGAKAYQLAPSITEKIGGDSFKMK